MPVEDLLMKGRLQRLEAVQAMMLEVGRASLSCNDISDFLKIVHAALKRIMYAENFYVTLYNKDSSTIRYVYNKDEIDDDLDTEEEFALASADESPTAWVILNRQPLLMTAAEDTARNDAGESWGSGSIADHWMGFPLLDPQRESLGAIVIQSYDKLKMYSAEDQDLFGIIASHVSYTLQSLQSIERLERAVNERTALLQFEIGERQRAENLQRALYQISELSNSVADTNKLYVGFHQIIGQLLDVKNFAITLYHPDDAEISIEYFVDEKEYLPPGTRFPFGVGLTSFVINTKEAQLIDSKRLQELISSATLSQGLGDMSVTSWMGAPMLAHDMLYGVIVVQSYDPAILYAKSDLDLLAFVANHVGRAIHNVEADRALRIAKIDLEQQNISLNQALSSLQQAQVELVRQEKLASLGSLVAGIAHEINTPLGICVTATSHLLEEVKISRQECQEMEITKQNLTQFFDMFDQGLRILTTNINRAATLVRGFKQVAVDQSSGELREFDIRMYTEEILQSLSPKFKGKGVEVNINCAVGLIVKNYPGAFSQVLSNLLMNSLLHGFENKMKGRIDMSISLQDGNVIFEYADNGIGMDAESVKKLFDPFYTTKRGQGGSGLGAHIVYNLVTGALNGTIQVRSILDNGLCYRLCFPQRLSPDTKH